MVVVDSSALIPLAWIGRLDLLSAVFDDISTTELVESEVVVEGKPGTSALKRFLDGVAVLDTPEEAEAIAELEGIALADASVVLLAEARDERLLANDRGLFTVARSHGVECWWVTTLLLHATREGVLESDEAKDVLYDLVDAGMNLSPQVYARLQQKLDER
jgi:predicted nucleic acid-binding protein